MEKTALEWFQILPEPFSSKAIKYTKKKVLKSDYPSLNEAIHSAFTWRETLEGDDYWSALYDITYCDDTVDYWITEAKIKQRNDILKLL